jgi:hypothetical protein
LGVLQLRSTTLLPVCNHMLTSPINTLRTAQDALQYACTTCCLTCPTLQAASPDRHHSPSSGWRQVGSRVLPRLRHACCLALARPGRLPLMLASLLRCRPWSQAMHSRAWLAAGELHVPLNPACCRAGQCATTASMRRRSKYPVIWSLTAHTMACPGGMRIRRGRRPCRGEGV